MTNNKESTRYYSNLQESSVASLLGGKKQSNSGAGKFAKGDVVVPEASLLCECKCPTTEKDSFSIKKEWIEKNKLESKQMRMDNHCIAFNFGPGQENYFIVDSKLMGYLVENLKKENS